MDINIKGNLLSGVKPSATLLCTKDVKQDQKDAGKNDVGDEAGQQRFIVAFLSQGHCTWLPSQLSSRAVKRNYAESLQCLCTYTDNAYSTCNSTQSTNILLLNLVEDYVRALQLLGS